ncbi:hypothetical protein CALCODRAFT_492282 [Calocera cornea HHB12733]|uniref:Uncharacterized protein n=1 Tax=Calocera cornea HHB12733 TaxID=1353952 RepID=A0A165IFM3_9BASI|nr:hypothetical protein CALCODRAFT_492282 [Calocera cornea HHB12733]
MAVHVQKGDDPLRRNEHRTLRIGGISFPTAPGTRSDSIAATVQHSALHLISALVPPLDPTASPPRTAQIASSPPEHPDIPAY